MDPWERKYSMSGHAGFRFQPSFVRMRVSRSSCLLLQKSKRIADQRLCRGFETDSRDLPAAPPPMRASQSEPDNINRAPRAYPPATAQREPVLIRNPNSSGAPTPPIRVPI